MSTVNTLVFPDLLYLENFGGDFNKYFNAVYNVFDNHFIKSNPYFQGVKISAQKFPLVDGIHKTFYHITHEGEDENNRTPDFRRMERIRYPKFSIEKCPHNEFLVWKNKRGKDNRVLIFNEVEGYLIVLTERKGFNLFWTAYYIEQNHRKRKLIAEYDAYIKAETAQGL